MINTQKNWKNEVVDGQRKKNSRLSLPKSGAGRLLPVMVEEGGGGRTSCWGVIFKIVIGFGEPCSDKGSLHEELFSISTKQ